MAQVLKYQAGGTAPKPIKVGNSYYTADQLKKELYGSKLDDYIKFQDFDSKRAQTFRKNLENQVNAIIDGSLRLEGNSLVDSAGRWKNNGEYAKAKLFGKLNDDQKANNESLDVANYLIRALNSGKISTYSAPDEYDITTALKGFDNVKDDDDWKKLDTKDRMSRIAKEFTNEATKLGRDQSYKDKYSYEGWQDAEWDKRADATIAKLNKIASILNNPNLTDLNKKIELGSLDIDLSDYLTQKEQEEQKKGEGQREGGQREGQKGGEGNPNAPTNINNGFSATDPFNFLDPVLYYNGKPYTYGTTEYYNLLKDRNNLYSEGMPLQDYVTQEINKQGKIDRSVAALQSVPEYYKYYSNVTPNFEGSTNIKAAYLLRPDALSSKGSILRIVDNNNGINDYIIDANKGRLYFTEQDKTGQQKKHIVGGKEIFKVFNTNGIVLDRSKIPSLDLGVAIGTTNDIFRGIERDKNNKPLSPTPYQYIERLVNYVNDNKDLINRQGSGPRKGTYLGSINKILGLNRKGQIKNIVTYSSDKKTIEIRAGGKTLYITLKTPYNDTTRDIHINNVDRIYVKKEGGVLKAQAGIKTQKLTNTSTTSEEQPENKLSTSLRGKKTLSKATNAALEATSEDTFSKTEEARLNLALLDVGSAVAGILPGLNAVSTATGVASSVGTAIADYVDVADGKMGFWDATKNLGMNLGMDAVSLLPGMKSLKVAKGIKTIVKILPRAMGAYWAMGLITDENQRKALLETGAKLSSGDFGKLNTQDFQNIATLIRMTTLGTRDANAARKKVFGNGKKGDVVITGKVGDSKVTKTISGDDAKDTLGRRFWGMNPKYKGNAKKALLEEANSNKDTQRMDAEGKTLDWGEKDIKNLKVETKPAPEEVTGPKAIFENFLGFGNKGFNVPLLSDKWLATRAFPRFHQGMVTKKDVEEMRKDPTNDEYDNINSLIGDPSSSNMHYNNYINRWIRNIMNEGTYEHYLNKEKARARGYMLDKGEIDASTVNMHDVASYAHEVLSAAREYHRYSTKKSTELIQSALNKQKTGKFSIQKFKIDLVREINQTLKTGALGELTINRHGKVVPKEKQGGRLDRGFDLINAYKSGGYMIPKFQNSGQLKLNYSYDPNKYYTDDIVNANTTTIKDLEKVFIKKGTPSQKGKNQKLAANDITAKDITYQTGIDYFRKYVENGEWVQAVRDYLGTHGANVYNTNISKLRELRSKFENSEYTNIKNDDVREFNKLFNSIFGKSYGEYSIDLQDIYGGATNLRHILSFLNLTDQKERRQFNIKGTDYWLDNAGYARTGKYGEQYVAPAQNSGTSVIPTDGNPAGTPTDGTSGTGGGGTPDGKKKTDATGQYTSDLTKTVTKPNPIQALRMSELAGALATNAKATNELLKYKAPTIDAPYRLAYLAGKYPVIAATQNQVGKVNTMASTPITSDVGTYLSNTQSAYSKGLTAMQNAYSENYNAYLASKDKVAEAGNYNNAASIQANNENVTKYVTAENMKNKVRADLYSSNFSQAIKPYLSETRTWLQEAETNRLKAKYEVENQLAKEDYANEIRVLNEETVANILNNAGSDRAKYEKDATGNRRSNEAIIQLYYAEHPDKASEYQQKRFDATQKYSKKLIENSTLMSPNFKWLTTTEEKYDFKKQGGSLTPNDRIKLQKIKDYNAARRQDSKESIKSITKDKEEFGKNYRAMSAGTLKMLERTLK